MTPYLPPELIGDIIEQITDHKTLAACSLTCRAWAPIAQSKYFRDLQFGQSSDKPTRFLEVIRESPHIALLPRSIGSNQWDVGDDDDGISLAEIAPLLLNVSSLSLEAVHLACRSSRKIVGAFPSLRGLQLYSCTVELQALSAFFQSHRTLRALSFHLGDIRSDLHREILPLRGLQDLGVLATKEISLLIPLLVDRETPLAPIECLDLHSLDPSDSVKVYTLLLGLRHTLCVLKIGVSYFHGYFSPYDALVKGCPVEHLTILREFVFTSIGFGFGCQSLKWVTALLQKVQLGGSVETLRFVMWDLEMPVAQDLDWDTMKTILIAMPRLHMVEFVLWGGNSATEMRSIVQQKLEGIEKECTLKLSGKVD